MFGFAGLLLTILLSVPVLSALPDLSTHRTVKVETDIQASAKQVWNVLTDFTSYANWNPYIYPASGTPVEGRQLNLTLHGSQLIQYGPTVVVSRPREALSWKSSLPAAAIARTLTWSIRPIDAGRTHVTVTEVFQGVLLPLTSGVVGDATGGLNVMMQALRTRAELLEYALRDVPALRIFWPEAPAAGPSGASR